MITVTFSGSPAELIELFQSNGFIDAVRAYTEKTIDKSIESKEVAESSSVCPSEAVLMDGNNLRSELQQPPSKKEEQAKPVASSVNRGSMVRATQEYASRMHNRYNGKDSRGNVDVCAMCAALISEVTEGKATKTSAVPDEYVDKVFNAVKADTIPAEYEYLLTKKEN